MTIADALVLLVAAIFATLCAWRSVEDIRHQLPAAQALQALAKLKDLEDEKLRKILDSFKAKDAPVNESLRKQVEEIERRAHEGGWTTRPAAPRPSDSSSSVIVTPPPEPLDAYMPFLE